MAHRWRDDADRPVAYEIRVRGELGAAWSDWLTGQVRPDAEGSATVIAGEFDQAGLHAVLRRLRDLGLPLVSMRRIEPGRAAADAAIEPREDRT